VQGEKEKQTSKLPPHELGNHVFLNDTVQRIRSQHARSLTPIDTRTQPMSTSEGLSTGRSGVPEVTGGASSSTGTSLTT
jgi:hypothetical protein